MQKQPRKGQCLIEVEGSPHRESVEPCRLLIMHGNQVADRTATRSRVFPHSLFDLLSSLQPRPFNIYAHSWFTVTWTIQWLPPLDTIR